MPAKGAPFKSPKNDSAKKPQKSISSRSTENGREKVEMKTAPDQPSSKSSQSPNIESEVYSQDPERHIASSRGGSAREEEKFDPRNLTGEQWVHRKRELKYQVKIEKLRVQHASEERQIEFLRVIKSCSEDQKALIPTLIRNAFEVYEENMALKQSSQKLCQDLSTISCVDQRNHQGHQVSHGGNIQPIAQNFMVANRSIVKQEVDSNQLSSEIQLAADHQYLESLRKKDSNGVCSDQEAGGGRIIARRKRESFQKNPLYLSNRVYRDIKKTDLCCFAIKQKLEVYSKAENYAFAEYDQLKPAVVLKTMNKFVNELCADNCMGLVESTKQILCIIEFSVRFKRMVLQNSFKEKLKRSKAEAARFLEILNLATHIHLLNKPIANKPNMKTVNQSFARFISAFAIENRLDRAIEAEADPDDTRCLEVVEV